MNPPASVSSLVQWIAKIAIFLVAAILAERSKLTPEVAAVFTGTLVSLGVTNAATLLASGNRILNVLHQFTPQDAAVIASMRPPPMPPPPPAPSPATAGLVALGGAAVLALAVATLGILHCGGEELLTPADQGAISTELDDQIACVRNNKGDAGATKACRARERAMWDRYWSTEFDGGKDAP